MKQEGPTDKEAAQMNPYSTHFLRQKPLADAQPRNVKKEQEAPRLKPVVNTKSMV